jgi:hypothetical protein
MQIEAWVALGILASLVGALEGGYRMGARSAKRREAPGGGQIGAIQGAVLGLLGLLLGFSFAGAAGRFIERQDMIAQEANAIGTAYLRGDMLDEPHRTALRDALTRYVDARLAAAPTLRAGLSLELKRQVAEQHGQIWSAASSGARQKPESMVAVLTPVNEVIDIHALRVAGGRKHLPWLLMGLLIACSCLAMATMGYGCGLAGRRCAMMTGALAVLVAAALWTTVDLDYGRVGLIQHSELPLQELRESMAPAN